ncbi:hypothetical protein EV361DRAFT_949830 [Lentinula raphanica]|nr:hypothetical protein EV361DRAFT_949830 [Lentinula raphanica]
MSSLWGLTVEMQVTEGNRLGTVTYTLAHRRALPVSDEVAVRGSHSPHFPEPNVNLRELTVTATQSSPANLEHEHVRGYSERANISSSVTPRQKSCSQDIQLQWEIRTLLPPRRVPHSLIKRLMVKYTYLFLNRKTVGSECFFVSPDYHQTKAHGAAYSFQPSFLRVFRSMQITTSRTSFSAYVANILAVSFDIDVGTSLDSIFP